jgi:hypothetical protein
MRIGLVAAHENAQWLAGDEAIGLEVVERTDFGEELEELGATDLRGRAGDDDVVPRSGRIIDGRAQGLRELNHDDARAFIAVLRIVVTGTRRWRVQIDSDGKRQWLRLPFFYLTVQLAHAVPHAVRGPRAEVL